MQTKGHKQDRQNRLRLLLPVGDEPYLYNNDYILQEHKRIKLQ